MSGNTTAPSTTNTGTNNNNNNEKAITTMVEASNDADYYYYYYQQQQQQQQVQLHQQVEYLCNTLARQLEYYFCTKNLLHDTYVQTLRSLNDGCVPISILVGFGKVGTITAALTATLKTMRELASSLPPPSLSTPTNQDRDEKKKNSKDLETENKPSSTETASVASRSGKKNKEDVDNDVMTDITSTIDIDSDDITSIAMQIVRTVATKYSVLLDTFKIDTETGKKIDGAADIDEKRQQQQKRPTWRWAVGTVSGHPIPMEKIESYYVHPFAQPASVGYVPVPVPDAFVVAPTPTTPPSSPGVIPTLDNSNSAAAAAAASTTTCASSTSPLYHHHHQNHHQTANTIILRDVPAIDSNETTIRKLFKDLVQPQQPKGDGGDDASPSPSPSSCPPCPAIVDAHLDVHDFWFVTFETTSRDVMADILLRLRRKKYPSSGIQIQARIKSIAAPSPNSYRHVPRPKSLKTKNGTGKSNKSSRKNRSRGRGSSNSGNKKHHQQQRQTVPTTSTGNGVNNVDKSTSRVEGSTTNQKGNKHRSSIESSKSDKAGTNSSKTDASVHPEPQKPPTMGEENFPTLPPLPIQTSAKTVIRVERSLTLGRNEDDDLLICNGDGELDEDDLDDVQSNGKARCGTFSDSASTATTTSSSSQSKQSSSNASRPGITTTASSAPMGGYAAALLKKASPSIPAKVGVGKSSSATTKSVDRKVYDAAGTGGHKHTSSNDAGSKISFADILRR